MLIVCFCQCHSPLIFVVVDINLCMFLSIIFGVLLVAVFYGAVFMHVDVFFGAC